MMFDIDDLNNIEVTGAMETSLPPIPVGEWPAYVKGIKGRTGEKDGNTWSIMDVTWAVTDPSVAEEVGLDEPTVRQTVFLDVENNQLALGKGKNIQLGRLREALGQNDDGRPWNFGMLENCQAIIKVSHRTYQDRIFAEVVGVAAA